MPFTRVVFIEEGDFRQQDSKDYYGLAPGKSVMLRWVWWVWAGVRWGEGGFLKRPSAGEVLRN